VSLLVSLGKVMEWDHHIFIIRSGLNKNVAIRGQKYLAINSPHMAAVCMFVLHRRFLLFVNCFFQFLGRAAAIPSMSLAVASLA
jgi:hypothetical protein